MNLIYMKEVCVKLNENHQGKIYFVKSNSMFVLMKRCKQNVSVIEANSKYIREETLFEFELNT